MPTSPTGTDAEREPAQETTRTSRARGFSLVELLIVLTLVVTLTAMLAPMLLPSPGRTLREAASDIATTLRETRRDAQARQARARFVMDTEAGLYGLQPAGRMRDLPEGVTAQLTTAESLLMGDTGGAIEFFPDGSSTGGRVVLGLADQAVQIDIEWLTGRIRVGGADQ